MTIKEPGVALNVPLAQWAVFYRDGEAFIYDDTDLFLDEDGEHMAQHPDHSDLAIYLCETLRWKYRFERCTITFDLYLKKDIELAEPTLEGDSKAAARLTPDVAIIKGIAQPKKATYIIDVDGPPPNVIFEVASESTFREDLTNKLHLYAEAFRAKEYVAYDPHETRLWRGPRLKAWTLVEGSYVEMERDERGWVWSAELECYLVEDGAYLRLFDLDGRQLLSPREAAMANEWQVAQIEVLLEEERLQLQQETQRAEQSQTQAKKAQAHAKRAQAQAKKMQAQMEQERLRAEQAEARIKTLEDQLRKNSEPE